MEDEFIRISIDSHPGELHSPINYSALQLASLGALPPIAPIINPIPNIKVMGGCEVQVDDEGSKYILSPKRNINGMTSLISGSDYLRGLQNLLKHDVIVRHLIMNNAHLSLSSDGSAIIKFKEKNTTFDSLLKSPAWTPLCDGYSPGLRNIRKIGDNRWSADSKIKSEPSVIVEIIRNPEENMVLFEHGIIDQTADTATPFNAQPVSTGRRLSNKTSLRAVIIFNNSLASKECNSLRKEISCIISTSDCGSHVGWAKIRSLAEDPEPLNKLIRYDWSGGIPISGLSLAYSDYYPNATVAWAIADSLHKYGIHCTPISDSYSNPKIKSDMRLVIISGPTNDSWGRYASSSLCPAWKYMKQEHNLFIKTLISADNELYKNEVLDGLLTEVCPMALIGAIPSVCLSNIND